MHRKLGKWHCYTEEQEKLLKLKSHKSSAHKLNGEIITEVLDMNQNAYIEMLEQRIASLNEMIDEYRGQVESLRAERDQYWDEWESESREHRALVRWAEAHDINWNEVTVC